MIYGSTAVLNTGTKLAAARVMRKPENYGTQVPVFFSNFEYRTPSFDGYSSLNLGPIRGIEP